MSNTYNYNIGTSAKNINIGITSDETVINLNHELNLLNENNSSLQYLNSCIFSTDNVGIGPLALNSLTTGNYNLFIGKESGYSNTTGYNNIGLGYQSLLNNNSSNNIALGIQSLHFNSVGENNMIFRSSNFSRYTLWEKMNISFSSNYNLYGISTFDTKSFVIVGNGLFISKCYDQVSKIVCYKIKTFH